VAGWLIDQLGYVAVFVAVAMAVIGGWLCTFGLCEPRHQPFETSEGLPGK
jgi:hypothetical protein